MRIFSIDQRQSEDPYSIQLNGGTRAPPWPPQEQNMTKFLVPTKLNENSIIVIEGRVTDDRLFITLSGDRGTAFEIDFSFSTNKIIYNPTKVDDETDSSPGDLFEGPDYVIQLHLSETRVRIMVGESYLNSIYQSQGWLEDFRYLSINGAVKELAFKFAQ